MFLGKVEDEPFRVKRHFTRRVIGYSNVKVVVFIGQSRFVGQASAVTIRSTSLRVQPFVRNRFSSSWKVSIEISV